MPLRSKNSIIIMVLRFIVSNYSGKGRREGQHADAELCFHALFNTGTHYNTLELGLLFYILYISGDFLMKVFLPLYWAVRLQRLISHKKGCCFHLKNKSPWFSVFHPHRIKLLRLYEKHKLECFGECSVVLTHNIQGQTNFTQAMQCPGS